jgi:hypothetical protein
LGQSRTVWLKAGKRHWAPGRKGLSRRAIDKSTQEYSDLWYAHVADAEIEALGCWTELQGFRFSHASHAWQATWLAQGSRSLAALNPHLSNLNVPKGVRLQRVGSMGNSPIFPFGNINLHNLNHSRYIKELPPVSRTPRQAMHLHLSAERIFFASC